jgi:LemA protein
MLDYPDIWPMHFLTSAPCGKAALDLVVAAFCVNVRLNSIPSRETPFMTGIIFLVVLIAVVVVLIGMYNGLVQLRVRCDSAWSDIDVQLKRRHDLIPNLVETVKGYAAHEKGTFENIAKFRSQAMQATTPEGKAVAENQLSGALKSLFAVAENYPELKASEEFTQLQGSLSQTEDAIQNARRYYNAVVRDLNTKIQSFPTNILAGMFGFVQRQFFETTEADREPVAVKF